LLQPTTPVCGLLLLMTLTVAEAQPHAARGRSITLAANPGEPLPEIRVAAGRKTLIVFDAALEKSSVQLDLTRVALVDVGERSLIIEPVVNPGDDERWVLRVRYVDGASPEWAAFALVSHPSEVDMQLEVVRQRQTLESCRAELARQKAEGRRAEVWVFADRLRGSSVRSRRIRGPQAQGWIYRLEAGLLLVAQGRLGAGQRSWTPTSATLRAQEGSKEEVRVLSVQVREGPLVPGKLPPVAVETVLPSSAAGESFILELRGEGGQRLEIDQVFLPHAPREQGDER